MKLPSINRKYVLTLLLSLFIFGWYYSEGYGLVQTDLTGETIEEAIFQATYKTNNRFGNIVETEKLEDNSMLVLYSDSDMQSYYVAILYKKWNGRWKVRDVHGGIPIKLHKGETAGFLDDVIYDSNSILAYWGVIYDYRVHSVEINNKKANIIYKGKNGTIFYKIYRPPIIYDKPLSDDLDNHRIAFLDKDNKILKNLRNNNQQIVQP